MTDQRTLMDAGAAAIRFNAPLGSDRVDRIADFVGPPAGTVVDIGCGAGALLIELAERFADVRAVGIDQDPGVIARAVAAADGSGVADRVRFEVADAADLVSFDGINTSSTGTGVGPAERVAVDRFDVALCIGSTHALGSTAAALSALAGLADRAVVGDGVWAGEPTAQHREWFGDLPDGESGLAELAVDAGWTVVDRSRSTLEEWDEFEHGWIDGVRSVATPEAARFADTRLDQYHGYRGVLGFGWLLLTSPGRDHGPGAGG